jgi:hypothetical protein
VRKDYRVRKARKVGLVQLAVKVRLGHKDRLDRLGRKGRRGFKVFRGPPGHRGQVFF